MYKMVVDKRSKNCPDSKLVQIYDCGCKARHSAFNSRWNDFSHDNEGGNQSENPLQSHGKRLRQNIDNNIAWVAHTKGVKYAVGRPGSLEKTYQALENIQQLNLVKKEFILGFAHVSLKNHGTDEGK